MTHDPPPIAPFAGDERIVVSSLPPHSQLGGLRGWQLLIPVAIVLLITIEWARTGRVNAIVFIGAALAIGLFIRLAIKFTHARRDKAETKRLGASAPWHAAISSASVDAEGLWLPKRIEERWKRLMLDRPPPALVDAELAPSVGAIPLSESLLEPEPINQSARGALLILIVMLFFALQHTFESTGRAWWRGLFFWAAAIVVALQIPAIRDRIPGLRSEGGDLVAGPGWLRDRTRRWTVADSTAIVFRTRESRPGVVVRFIGPAGVRDVQFAGVDNPDFALLWERWMHLVPRLDLEA